MDTQRPAIFTLVSVPIIGQLGPDSEIVEREPCEACGVSYREEVTFLDYQFDTWERAELIKAGHDNYAITRRLHDIFQKARLQGLSTQPMKISRGDIFEQIDPEHHVAIPEFLRVDHCRRQGRRPFRLVGTRRDLSDLWTAQVEAHRSGQHSAFFDLLQAARASTTGIRGGLAR